MRLICIIYILPIRLIYFFFESYYNVHVTCSSILQNKFIDLDLIDVEK